MHPPFEHYKLINSKTIRMNFDSDKSNFVEKLPAE